MHWALVDRTATYVSLPCDPQATAPRSLLARLPAECGREFLNLLQEACADGRRRRMGITRPERPLLVVDILPLQLQLAAANPALVVLYDSGEFDSAYDRPRKLARRNEAILRSSMDGFFVVDADCRFLEFNEAFCRMTGYSAEELLRMRISDLEVEEHANGGVPSHTRTGLHQFPTAHRHKDGHIVHLEISVNVLHDNGEKILVGFARDVTERKRAAEELARLTRQQKLILDSVADGIAGLDRAGGITFVNPAAARLLGYAPGELIGRAAHQVFLGSAQCAPERPMANCPVCSATQGPGGALCAEAEFEKADGTRFPVEYSLSSLVGDADGGGAVLVFKDMSERRRVEEERRVLEAQVQRAQKLESLGLLAGGIAHDLNNLLVGVQGNACLALTELADERSVRDRLQRIVGACERAAKVIRQILVYSGRVTCDASPLDLNKLGEDLREFLRAAVPRTIHMDLQLEPGLPLVQADAGQLQQVITALLVNAIEAIGDQPGRIALSTARLELSAAEIQHAFPGQDLAPGLYAALHVEDSGCGMSAETLAHVFEPFFTSKGAGRGLGLAAMHGVVRAHHGGVRVESEVGRGTRFSIVLPALAQPVTLAAPPPPRRLDVGKTILLIDDEDEVRSVLQDMLAHAGLRVLTAEDGTRGVETYRQHAGSIDAVILDMTMPDKSGVEVFQEIRAIRPDAKVIVTSGYSAERVPACFGAAQPAAFLAKPFTTDTLLEKLGGVLGRTW